MQVALMATGAALSDQILTRPVSEGEAHVSDTVTHSMQPVVNVESAANDRESTAELDAAPEEPRPTTEMAAKALSEQDPLSGRTSEASEHTSAVENSQPVTRESQPCSPAATTEEATELQQRQPSQSQLDSTPANLLIGPPDAPEFVTKSNKLLALKQRRLGSLSSSMDLSRESSFDITALHTGLDDASSSQQKTFRRSASHGEWPVQSDSQVNEQASSSLAPLPLDSSTGIVAPSLTHTLLCAKSGGPHLVHTDTTSRLSFPCLTVFCAFHCAYHAQESILCCVQ